MAQVGTTVNVRSKRDDQWYSGRVLRKQDSVLSVEYVTSDGSKTTKHLPLGHSDLDLSPTATGDASGEERPGAASVEERNQLKFTLCPGDPVEIWSKSWSRWCPGNVLGKKESHFIIEYTAEGAPSSIVKALPPGHQDLRPPLGPIGAPVAAATADEQRERALKHQPFSLQTGQSYPTAGGEVMKSKSSLGELAEFEDAPGGGRSEATAVAAPEASWFNRDQHVAAAHVQEDRFGARGLLPTTVASAHAVVASADQLPGAVATSPPPSQPPPAQAAPKRQPKGAKPSDILARLGELEDFFGGLNERHDAIELRLEKVGARQRSGSASFAGLEGLSGF